MEEALPSEKIDDGGARVEVLSMDGHDSGSGFPGLTPEIQLVTRPPNASFVDVLILEVRFRKKSVDSVRSNMVM